MVNHNIYDPFAIIFYIPLTFIFLIFVNPTLLTSELVYLFSISIPYSIIFYSVNWFMDFFRTKNVSSYYLDDIDLEKSSSESESE
jgi:hypothetical protein